MNYFSSKVNAVILPGRGILCGHRGNPGPALVLDVHHNINVTEALSKEGIDVIGCDNMSIPFGILPRTMVDFVVHPNFKPLDCYINFLARILEDREAACLVPCSTKTVGVVSRNLTKLGSTPSLLPCPESYEMAVDRLKLIKVAQRAGVPVPNTRAFNDPGDVEVFPAVSKPRFEKGGAVGFRKIHDSSGIKEALELGRRVGPLVLQEYVPGDSTNMRTCNLLFDDRSRPRAIFTMRKIRERFSTGGPTIVGVSSNDPNIVELAVNLLTEMKWRGVAEVEFKIDPRDGVPRLMEVNPRFWAYLRLPVACGVNFPKLLYRLSIGEDFDLVNEYPVGVGYVNARYRLRSCIRGYFEAPREGGLVFDYHPMEPYLLSSTIVEVRRRFREWSRRRRLNRSSV